MARQLTVAIDGPVASGKSTLAGNLAHELGYLYFDTGAMYRAVTLAALRAGIDIGDESAVTALAQVLVLDIKPFAGESDGRQYTVLLDGEDVTWELRSPAVDGYVSQVSSYPGVREEMVRRQRQFGARGHVVMVGRDIGTVVMPEAPLKLYVTASPEERARRRWRDRQVQGHEADYEAILADIIRRDRIDSSREHSPLRPAVDAVILDTTRRSPEQIVDEMVALLPEPVNGRE